MSYYNQPDHERLDRRDDKARELLLRISRARTTLKERAVTRHPSARPSAPPPHADGLHKRFLEVARARELELPDEAPLVEGGAIVPLAWRTHYVAASFEPVADEVLARLEDKGFAIFVLGTTEAAWDAVLGKLSLALGKTADAAGANKGDA
jgi:hypothetical protein